MRDDEYDALQRRHRRELHVHCYRMLASFDDAEDAVQETFFRAWRKQDTLDDESAVRAWLYRIATNVCLDMIRAKKRRVARQHAPTEVPWLQPYPDHLLDEVAAEAEAEPDAVIVDRETIELAFLVAMQTLPPKQRAALILRDVLGMSAAETATLLETSVAAANSALQRARATMQEHLPSHRRDWTATEPNAHERELLALFIDAHERADAKAAVAIATTDLRITMPPQPHCFDGLDVIAGALETAFGVESEGDWRLVPIKANRMPAAASYLRRWGDTEFRAFKIDLVRIEGDRIAELTTFGVANFPKFGLPPILAGAS